MRMFDLAISGGCAGKVPPSVSFRFWQMTLQPESDFMADAAFASIEGVRLGASVDVIACNVPDAADFGRIAAANALSDLYVSGARPAFALAFSGVPRGDALSIEFGRALNAARYLLAQEGCPLIGGHSVYDSEPKLGFAIVGHAGASVPLAQPVVGDVVLLSKPIGSGILTAAVKRKIIGEELLQPACCRMMELNSIALSLRSSPLAEGISGITDVTGYGLLGHSMELGKRLGLGLRIRLDSLPVFPNARSLAQAGVCTSAFTGNMAYVVDVYKNLSGLPLDTQILLTDPQTSGGILMSVRPEALDDVIRASEGRATFYQIGCLAADAGLD
jgi:selenide,water dikinase